MQCKHHPNKKAEYFCSSCGIPLCKECAEEVTPGVHFCFQCAMFQTVSGAGTTLKDKRKRLAAKRQAEKEKKKWGPFQYFIVVSSVLIAVMWVVILFGGQKAPAGASDFAENDRTFLFLVNASIKRYAHYERNQYPKQLADLIPKYLQLSDKNLLLLDKLSYNRLNNSDYRLSWVTSKPNQMNVVITSQGIKF